MIRKLLKKLFGAKDKDAGPAKAGVEHGKKHKEEHGSDRRERARHGGHHPEKGGEQRRGERSASG